ncbi:hypothetical protein [Rubrobacter indicoceani]|uniref:hypothetical protein n=1 Tax=Rubrobacter indicoceani TaxID=2051957 RepID=UPI0013C3E7CE|nr:hypothetical protein [Rubrobacter indicoceani]
MDLEKKRGSKPERKARGKTSSGGVEFREDPGLDTSSVTPAQVAIETSPTAKEADKKTKELASGGRLKVRVRGRRFSALWGCRSSFGASGRGAIVVYSG